MGKTIKKNQTARVRRTATSGAFVVRGKRFELAVCNPANIAEYLREVKRYPVGTMVKYRGADYRLETESTATDVRHKLVLSV